MTQISFYSLSKGDEDTRLQFACRLVEKAFSLGHKIFIQVEDEQQQRLVDDLLWQFKASSFIPHAVTGEGTEAIEIGLASSPSHQDVLINLSAKQCEQHQQFKRINEIVGPDEDSLATGRQIYRFYQTQGFKPDNHKV
ncbi:MAG: DNA polymerase III subunit chi [Pseudomonadales bacterium]|nr:DNA polymerase III subunit chi [Pseudomonadales bacterium]